MEDKPVKVMHQLEPETWTQDYAVVALGTGRKRSWLQCLQDWFSPRDEATPPVIRLQRRQRVEFRIKGMATFPRGFIFEVENLLKVPHFGEWVFVDFGLLMSSDLAYNASEELEHNAGGLRVIDVAHNFRANGNFIRIDLVPDEMYASVSTY
jgi:hypothetical protein